MHHAILFALVRAIGKLGDELASLEYTRGDTEALVILAVCLVIALLIALAAAIAGELQRSASLRRLT